MHFSASPRCSTLINPAEPSHAPARPGGEVIAVTLDAITKRFGKITARMKKLGEWMDEDATKRMHPVERAARFHFKLMNIYPWTLNSGRVARVLSNLMKQRGVEEWPQVEQVMARLGGGMARTAAAPAH